MTTLDNDKYGRSVTLSSDGTTDTYTIDDSFSLAFPTGTSLDDVYNAINAQQPNIPDLATAKAKKISDFTQAVNDYLDQHYDFKTRQQLTNLYFLANIDNKLNRAAYLRQGINWVNSILSYSVTFGVSINAQVSAAAVVAMTWDIDDNVIADPAITIGAALQIPN